MLNEEQIQKVRLFLVGTAWNDVIKPVLMERGHNLVKTLVNLPAERGAESEDANVVRGRIKEVEWFLSAWSNEVVVFDQNRAREELMSQQNSHSTENP